MLTSILTTTTTSASTITIQGMLICTLASLVFGFIAAGVYMYKNNYSKNFVVTLALLPAMIQIVIALVNGNLGTGIAVLGAFSLVRFRSVPGSAREISSIFFAMALGLATGMGYLGYAAIFLIIICVVSVIIQKSGFGEQKTEGKSLKVTIPENLDYTDIFSDLFEKYTKESELIQVKTTNMGSLYELQYKIMLKDKEQEKALLDEIRCRNGNLTIICGKVENSHNVVL